MTLPGLLMACLLIAIVIFWVDMLREMANDWRTLKRNEKRERSRND